MKKPVYNLSVLVSFWVNVMSLSPTFSITHSWSEFVILFIRSTEISCFYRCCSFTVRSTKIPWITVGIEVGWEECFFSPASSILEFSFLVVNSTYSKVLDENYLFKNRDSTEIRPPSALSLNISWVTAKVMMFEEMFHYGLSFDDSYWMQDS